MSSVYIFVVDEHHEALSAQHAMIGAGRCPSSGLLLEHFDAHPDLVVPRDINGKLTTDPERRAELRQAIDNTAQSIAAWITPAIAAGLYRRVVWRRPDWITPACTPLSDGSRPLVIGAGARGKLRALGCDPQDNKYFCGDATGEELGRAEL
eukprot:5457852-Prymnesium_polylepis.1